MNYRNTKEGQSDCYAYWDVRSVRLPRIFQHRPTHDMEFFNYNVESKRRIILTAISAFLRMQITTPQHRINLSTREVACYPYPQLRHGLRR